MTNKITENEWNLIISDYKKGLKPYQLAEKYKHGSSTIIDKLCSLGLHTKRYRFTEEDVEFLRNHYRNYNAVIHRAQKLQLQSCINRPWTEEENEYIKTHWVLEPDYIMGIKLNRTQRCVQYQRNALGLYRRDMNIVTYENLSKYIRGQIWGWKKKSMENCDYKCVFTGSKDFQIHHLYNVNSMINNVFKLNNIKRKENLSDYSKEELDNIVNLFINEQNKYPLGVCVSKDIHVLFHSLYGQYNNTPEQWYQFEKDYKSGLYDNYIKEKEIS